MAATVYQFVAPAGSLKIQAKEGADTIEVKSLDPLFSADLLLYGNREGAPTGIPDLATDTILFSGNTYTDGGDIEAFAEAITVGDGVIIDTRPDTLPGETGNITFRARRINITELTNLSPLMVNVRDVEISIGADAELRGGDIYLFAQAEDRSLTTLLGTDRVVNNFVIKPLANFVAGLAAMPVKVLYKQSEATITIGEDAQIVGSGTVGLYATAAADASGVAKSIFLSVGLCAGHRDGDRRYRRRRADPVRGRSGRGDERRQCHRQDFQQDQAGSEGPGRQQGRRRLARDQQRGRHLHRHPGTQAQGSRPPRPPTCGQRATSRARPRPRGAPLRTAPPGWGSASRSPTRTSTPRSTAP